MNWWGMENIPPYVQASKYRIIPNITCMKEKFCIAGFDTTDRPRSILTAFACYALKNPHCNATVGWPRNISHRNFPTSTLCIYKKRPPLGACLFSGGVVTFDGIRYDKYRVFTGNFYLFAVSIFTRRAQFPPLLSPPHTKKTGNLIPPNRDWPCHIRE